MIEAKMEALKENHYMKFSLIQPHIFAIEIENYVRRCAFPLVRRKSEVAQPPRAQKLKKSSKVTDSR